MFCRQQQLAEPIFTISTAPVKPLSGILRSYQKLKDSECDDSDNQYMSREKEEKPGSETGYRCEVKILSKSQDLVLDCSWGNFYERENYAIQNASLKALSWFSRLFDDLDADPEQPRYTNEDLDWLFQRSILMKGNFPTSRRYEQPTSKSRLLSMPRERITNGSLVSVCYSVSLEVDADFSRNGESLKELIESNEEIEFEVGNGSMNPHLESVVTQMSVGQSACFLTDGPAEGLLLAAASDTVRARSLLSGNASNV